MATMNDWVSATPERQRLFAEEQLIAITAEEIYSAMERVNISKSTLAEVLDRSKAYISQVLSGSRNMTLRTLADIAEALDAKVDLRLSDKHVHGIWEPMNCAQVVKLRPDAALRFESTNEAVEDRGSTIKAA